MEFPIKITRLEVENVKRVRAVALEPTERGLTVIGGRNGQGKTSVLDAIAWALGGDRLRPAEPHRDGSVLPPEIRVKLSNGITVERKGKNGALKVTDPKGGRSGQQLLNQFVEQLALDLPKFMAASDREKADTLLRVIGVGDELKQLDQEEARLYADRTAVGRIADQKSKFAAEMPFYEGMPDAPVSPMELIRRQQDILARNGENARKRARKDEIARALEFQNHEAGRLRHLLDEAEAKRQQLEQDLDAAQADALSLHDESTDELERALADVEETNRKVRANLDREHARDDAQQYAAQYAQLSVNIDGIRSRRRALLESADLPLPGLGVSDGCLTYNGHTWNDMSGSEQLRAATAIVRALNPRCGFVLMDGLEAMDPQTLADFGSWLKQEGLQVIATRVSTGDECSIIIEDGSVLPTETPRWKAGEF